MKMKILLVLIFIILCTSLFLLCTHRVWFAERATVRVAGEKDNSYGRAYRKDHELFVRVSREELYLLDLKERKIVGVAVVNPKHYIVMGAFLVVLDKPPLKTDPFKIEGNNYISSSGSSLTFKTFNGSNVAIDLSEK
ncbi:MAG: hypothetical protein JWQ87_5277 [Candidatus Sulfotelmatobacter sp.]|nr:hypothetical protein [Candidatus Sulfotelmatobacter sp.]